MGETVQLAAVARGDDGRDIPGKTFVWTTSDEHVAALGSAALVTAVANGQATISATTDGVTGSARIEVAQAVALVDVTPGNSLLTSIGETLQLSATARDGRHNPLTGDRTPTWVSSAPAVASVDSRGLVTAERDGDATVTATLDGVIGNATVRVAQAPARLAFLAQPMTAQAGASIIGTRVAVQDARGHTVAKASNAVTLSLAPNAAGGTLSGVRTVSALAGVASFSNLAIDRPAAGYTLVASSAGLASATSSSFDVISSPARFDELRLRSTTVAIGGLGVPYSARVTNARGHDLASAGVQAWIRQGPARRAAGGALVRDCGAAVGILAPGACDFTFTLNASNSGAGIGTLVPGPATARFDLFGRSTVLDSVEVPITLETFVPPPTPPARITDVQLNSTTLKIGGPSVPYTATLVNDSPSSVLDVFVQGYVVQGSTSRAAGGAVVSCVPELGVFPPGACTFRFTLIASNTTGGNGTLVPGAATARFELRWPYGELAVFTVPITLVN